MSQRCGATHPFVPPPETRLSPEPLGCSRPKDHAGEHYLVWGGRSHGVEWKVEVSWYAVH